MRMKRQAPALVVATLLAVGAGCNQAPKALTPEEARAKGDGMLRQMSQTLAAIADILVHCRRGPRTSQFGRSQKRSQVHPPGYRAPAQRNGVHQQG